MGGGGTAAIYRGLNVFQHRRCPLVRTSPPSEVRTSSRSRDGHLSLGTELQPLKPPWTSGLHLGLPGNAASRRWRSAGPGQCKSIWSGRKPAPHGGCNPRPLLEPSGQRWQSPALARRMPHTSCRPPCWCTQTVCFHYSHLTGEQDGSRSHQRTSVVEH